MLARIPVPPCFADIDHKTHHRSVMPSVMTVALLSAVPEPDPRRRKKRLVLKGDVPSPVAPPPGCRFHTRCWLREQLGNPERCATEEPTFRDLGDDHFVACHFAEDIDQTATDPTGWTLIRANGQADRPGRPTAPAASRS